MSRRNKLQRYADNAQSANVIDANDAGFEQMKGQWQQNHFKNDRPLTMEFACGRGEYTVGLAAKFPERNYIGVDLKGDRVWVGSQQAQELGLTNVAFLRSRIELVPNGVAPGELDEIWLTFPDPRPKDRDEKHRLTNIFYLNMYRTLLRADGWFRFKTDNTPLFDYTLEVLAGMQVRDMEYTYDLYQSPLLAEHHGVKTKYEKIWTEKGESIKYLKLRFAK